MKKVTSIKPKLSAAKKKSIAKSAGVRLKTDAERAHDIEQLKKQSKLLLNSAWPFVRLVTEYFHDGVTAGLWTDADLRKITGQLAALSVGLEYGLVGDVEDYQAHGALDEIIDEFPYEVRDEARNQMMRLYGFHDQAMRAAQNLNEELEELAKDSVADDIEWDYDKRDQPNFREKVSPDWRYREIS